MFYNNTYVEEISRDGKLKMPTTTIFIGSYYLAIAILVKLTKDFPQDEALAAKCWRVQFDDPETKADRMQRWRSSAGSE